MTRGTASLLAALSLLASPHGNAAPGAQLLASWVAMDAPTGHEHHATGALRDTLDGWTLDASGNLSKTVGKGPGTTLVACLLDAPSMTVSRIRDDGYLRLHAVGRPAVHPLWAQFHEGQQLRILTREGPVIGVSALANGHFMNLHRDEPITRVDDLWLDVGASSREEVLAMGIRLLDPVLRHLPAWHFEGQVAGPAAGARAGCAAVVAAAEARIGGGGRTRYLLSTQSAFRGVGLSAAAAAIDDLERVILLGAGVARHADAPLNPLPAEFSSFDESLLTVINPRVDNAGGLMERLHEEQARALAQELLAALGRPGASLDWRRAPAPAAPRNGDVDWLGREEQDAQIAAFAQRLKQLGELHAVSGHEAPVSAAVRSALPPWAGDLAETDALGNIWVDTGPADKPATVFMAHMDEVGWKVTEIHEDGSVDLEQQGGSLAVAREGQPALLQLSVGTAAPEMLRGVFLNRREPAQRWPERLQAWFGMDRKALLAAGVEVGMPVTGYKEAHRLGAYRFSVRGMDDRVGTAALLAAVNSLDPASLDNRVIFAWSVREETGLQGARALARRLAAQTQRIYSIDTFVTSDTPLESPHFAFAPLGQGPVLRSMESSGLVSPRELDRNRRIAAAAEIAVQVGMTQGGTDGTAFTFYGAPNAGLSWPGRYSHGPAELGDLRDMVQLVSLIRAFAEAAD
jgi:putative aminopeptidase FrvX